MTDDTSVVDSLVLIINDLLQCSPTFIESGNYHVCVFCRHLIEDRSTHSSNCPWVRLSSFDVKLIRQESKLKV